MRAWNIGTTLFLLFVLAAVPVGAEAVDAKTPVTALPESKELRVAPNKNFPALIFSQSEEDNAKMDVHPSQYADFWKKWRLVATRWRQDIREFRLTYANDLAWKTLSEKRTDYPVGAMFGKLAFPAEEDLALPSSVMPSSLLNRLMIMLWDPKHKKASSDGWVYLRFINPDPRSPQDKDSSGVWGVMTQKEVNACVECHARAADRGYVFSQPVFMFSDAAQAPVIKDTKVLATSFNDMMKELPAKDIPRIALNLIDSFPDWKKRKIMGYEGNFFAGALGEMGPVLAKIAQKNVDNVYMIFDRDDPNTIEIVSSMKKAGHENCAGLVRLRGSGLGTVRDQADIKKRVLVNNGDEAYPHEDMNVKNEAQGVRVRDMQQEYKPSAMLYTICGADGVSRQNLPLLYSYKDKKDNLPSYYFAPAVRE